jgi:O-Antigen ligase
VALILAVVVIGAAALVAWIWQRPQRGLLTLAALVPFHGLLLIVPSGDRVNMWKELLIGITLIAAACAPVRERLPRPAFPWWPAVAALIVMGSVSALANLGKLGLVPIKVTFFYTALLMVAHLRPLTGRDRDTLVSIMMGTGVATAVFGVAQQFIGPAILASWGFRYNHNIRFSGSVMRSFSTFVQPFPFALFLMLVLLVGGAVALSDTRRLRNRLFLISTPVFVVAIGFTIVRAAMTGLLAGLVILGIYRYRRILWGMGIFAMIAMIAASVLPTSYLTALSSQSSLQERARGWKTLTDSLLVGPFGTGLGRTGAAADRIDKETLGPRASELPGSTGDTVIWGRPYQPDNYYFKMIIELGPLGITLFAAILVIAFLAALRASRYLPKPDDAFVLSVAAVIAAAAVASLTATFFEIFPVDCYFWLLLAAAGCAITQKGDPHPVIIRAHRTRQLSAHGPRISEHMLAGR